MLQGRMVRTIYFQKEYWFRVVHVLFEFEMDQVKSEALPDYLRRKHKIDFGDQPFVLETEAAHPAKRFLIPELCELSVEANDSVDCTAYCRQLVYWNNVLNFNQEFIQALRACKVVIAGSHIEMHMQYLDPGVKYLI